MEWVCWTIGKGSGGFRAIWQAEIAVCSTARIRGAFASPHPDQPMFRARAEIAFAGGQPPCPSSPSSRTRRLHRRLRRRTARRRVCTAGHLDIAETREPGKSQCYPARSIEPAILQERVSGRSPCGLSNPRIPKEPFAKNQRFGPIEPAGFVAAGFHDTCRERRAGDRKGEYKVSKGAPRGGCALLWHFRSAVQRWERPQRPPAAGARRNPVLLLKIISRAGLSFL